MIIPAGDHEKTDLKKSITGAVTTVTFQERGDQTLVVWHDLYPSKEALDAAMADGSCTGFADQFVQLDELLGTLNA